jgi:peptide/nickel transport system substrate-binding protein
VADGGTLRWAVEALPATLNAFQADADAATSRIAGAVLPALFTLDGRGRPQRNPDYVETAEIVEREPKQVVLYKLNQKAAWSDGREIGAADFVAQWRALNGRDSAYWSAHNAGYERIEKIEQGAGNLQVKITFNKPYADWQSLFTPLYPKEVTGSPNAFNDGARSTLKATAGPFHLSGIDRGAGTATLVRNPRWWGGQAKLERVVLTAVPREKRSEALAAGNLDLAEIDPPVARRISLATESKGGKGSKGGTGAAAAGGAQAAKPTALGRYVVRKSLEPAYTQLALNGETGPLSDARVRRAVARALNRKELAQTVLGPLGLPAVPPGSHLALAGQRAYTDNSDALGEQSTQEARALLADAGWTPGGAAKKSPAPAEAGNEAEPGGAGAKPEPGKTQKKKAKATAKAEGDTPSNEGLYIVGDDKPVEKPGGRPIGGHGPGTGGAPLGGPHVLAPAPAAALQSVALERQALAQTQPQTQTQARQTRIAGAYAPRGTAAPAKVAGPIGKDGKPLTLRFVLPAGPGSESLRAVGDKIARMLGSIGVQIDVTKVPDAGFFRDHIASGNFDLALYSWPATAYPATEARPIFAKPEPASDGSLTVEQNYARVGTDYIDQLFDQALAELDEEEARELVRRADARIWAAAGSIPLYQRPELVAARPQVVNAGAFGFATPRYEDMGFRKAESKSKKANRS